MSASNPFAWLHGTGAGPAGLNGNGGAIAPGQSLEVLGTKLLTTRGGGWRLQAMRDGGGLPNLTITEALQP